MDGRCKRAASIGWVQWLGWVGYTGHLPGVLGGVVGFVRSDLVLLLVGEWDDTRFHTRVMVVVNIASCFLESRGSVPVLRR